MAGVGACHDRTKAKRQQSKDATDLHAANFIECVRSRKSPNAGVEIGVLFALD